MSTALLILILLGALISVVAAFLALKAYLRFRDARAAELPIQISELQQSLTTLQVLTTALGTSLRQVQKVLSYNALKTLSADRIGRILQAASAPKDTQRSG